MPKPTKDKEIVKETISENGIVSETNLKKEDLLKDLNLIFSYARSHVANNLPLEENIMIGLIEIKKVLINIINKNE